MKNPFGSLRPLGAGVKFAAFGLGLAAAVVAAVSSLDAQGPARGSSFEIGAGSRLGVMVSDLDSKEGPGGAKIDEVSDDSAAAKAGLKAGDVVVEFDGERVRSARQFSRLVRETPDGRTVKMAVLRNGQRQTLDATPEAGAFSWSMEIDGDRIHRDVERGMRGLPRWGAQPPLAFDFRADPGGPRRFEFRLDDPDMLPGMRWAPRRRLAVTVESLSPQLGEYFGVKDGGALVSSVTKGSAADKAGLKAGDVITSVNGDRVRDADSLIREISDTVGAELSIGIVRDKKESTVKATIDDDDLKGLALAGGSSRSRPGVRIQAAR